MMLFTTNFRLALRTTAITCAACAIALSVLAVTGCTNAVREPVLLDNAEHDTSIMSLHQYIGFPGTAEKPRIVKVFMVHGMTHSDPDWADPFIVQFAARLGVQMPKCVPAHVIKIPTTLPPQLQPPPAATPPPPLPSTNLCIVASPPLESGKVFYQFFVLQWSPLTDAYKCAAGMESDREKGNPISTTYDHPETSTTVCPNGGEYYYPRRRAQLNGPLIKDVVMNNGFPDAVLYLAPNFGPVIRTAVAQALCIMVAYAPSDPASGRLPAPPSPPCVSLPPVHDDDRFVFITHSLGANVLLDTLCDLLPCAEPRPTRGAPAAPFDRLGVEAISRAKPLLATFAQATPFYMLANQYLLLGLHEADPAQDFPGADLGRLFDIRRHPFFKQLPPAIRTDHSPALLGGAADVLPPSIDVIAFSDPNDDLSFVLPEFPNSPLPVPTAEPTTRVRVRNVLVTNDVEWLGIFENPAAAHLNYYTNPGAGILDVIFCGMDGGRANICFVRP